jgi:hypothetical protein
VSQKARFLEPYPTLRNRASVSSHACVHDLADNPVLSIPCRDSSARSDGADHAMTTSEKLRVVNDHGVFRSVALERRREGLREVVSRS